MANTSPERLVDEEALMAAYARGDDSAFVELFGSVGPTVQGFFIKRFHDPTVAEDLLQTTFLKLHRARHDYRTGAPLRPWLFTIASRVGIDELRRRAMRRAVSRAQLDQLPDRSPDTGPAAERAERAARVRQALEILPASQRVVIELHRYQGLSLWEVAHKLGTTVSATKLRAFRAYRRLRRELSPLLP